MEFNLQRENKEEGRQYTENHKVMMPVLRFFFFFSVTFPETDAPSVPRPYF